MSEVTKSGRLVKKSAKFIEMELNGCEDSADKKKRRKLNISSKTKAFERKHNHFDAVQSTSFSVPLEKCVPLCADSQLLVMSANLSGKNMVMEDDGNIPPKGVMDLIVQDLPTSLKQKTKKMDTTSGSDSNIATEYSLEEDTSSESQTFHESGSKKVVSKKQNISIVIHFSDITDVPKQRKAIKKKDKKSEARKPSAAFIEWSKTQLIKMKEEHPDCDMDLLKNQLTGFWRCVSAKEKMRWHRRSQRTGETAEIIEHEVEVENLSQTFFLQKIPFNPVEIAAHFSLIGDSLVNIGARLQEHKGKVPLDGNISILLDSLLSTLVLLMALASNIPEINSCPANVYLDTIDKLKVLFEVG